MSVPTLPANFHASGPIPMIGIAGQSGSGATTAANGRSIFGTTWPSADCFRTPRPKVASKSGRNRPVAFKAKGAGRHHGFPFKGPRGHDRDHDLTMAEQRSKLGDTDCERRLNGRHSAVMPPSTNSRAPVT